MSSDRGSQWSSLGEVSSDRIVYGGWDETVAASQAAAEMDSQIGELRPSEAGIIYQLCAYAAEATTGTGTFTLYINGVTTGMAVHLWGGAQSESLTLYPELEFEADDLIEIYAATDGSWTPIRVRVVIAMTPGGVAQVPTSDLFLVETSPNVFEFSTTGPAGAVVTEQSATVLVLNDDTGAADQVDIIHDAARNLIYFARVGSPRYGAYIQSLDPWGYYPMDAPSVAWQDFSGNGRNFSAGSGSGATYPVSLLPNAEGVAYAGTATHVSGDAYWLMNGPTFPWNEWTMSFWYLYQSATNGYPPHLWFTDGFGDDNGLYLRRTDAGGGVTPRIYRDGANVLEGTNISGLNHIVARSRDGAQSLWINGVQVFTASAGGSVASGALEGRSQYLQGGIVRNTWKMDELVLFNRYITDVECEGLYDYAAL